MPLYPIILHYGTMTKVEMDALDPSQLLSGVKCQVSDLGYQEWVWDGTKWNPTNNAGEIVPTEIEAAISAIALDILETHTMIANHIALG